MRIVIIGAVAAGTSAGAKARRNHEGAEIVIYEKDNFISYSGCGIPYFIGGDIESVEQLTPRTPTFFKKKYNIDVKTGFEVMKIDPQNKKIEVKELAKDRIFTDTYDKLIIATGAMPVKPDIVGVDNDNVFFIRNIKDTINVKSFIDQNKPKTAVIAGTGFIGFEMLENLQNLGMKITMVELADQITPNLDADMSKYLETELKEKSISIIKNTAITKIFDNKVILSTGEELPADFVILSTGVRPNTALAKQCGIKLGIKDAIAVNTKLQTNYPDIYACGDCIETYSSITGKAVYCPLGSTANKTGRIAGDVVTGGSLEYRGNLGTGIFKLFNLTVATTGLTQKEAIACGYDIEICHNIKHNKPDYMGGEEMVIKAIADKKTQNLLGVQIIGREGVDKRIDVFATLITYKATVSELFHLDLAYAPPFSTTKDPVHYTGMILDNALNRGRELITSEELEKLDTSKVQIVDARSSWDYENKGHLMGAVNISQAKLRDETVLDKDKMTVTYCNKGVTSNAAQNILINRGFKKVLNLSGGQKFNKATKK